MTRPALHFGMLLLVGLGVVSPARAQTTHIHVHHSTRPLSVVRSGNRETETRRYGCSRSRRFPVAGQG